MSNKFVKNKNVNPNIYREMAMDSNCELPCAVDEQNVNIRKDGTVGTLTTDGSSPKKNNRVLEKNLRIRRLTPKECFRLMGFDDSDFEKAEKLNSNTQLYKQAGNSIVVPVVEHIIKALFDCGALENTREERKMELRMNQYQLPEKVGFNYEELKTELQAKVSQYETLIYSDEQIKEAKTDKASLNKLKKALNDERIRLQKEYMQPFNEFKAKIDELIGIIDKPVGLIDKQVKEYEEQKKAEKLAQIQEYWNRVASPEHPLKLERVLDQKWLNASTSMKSIQESINSILAKYAEDIATLQNLPEFAFEAVETYKTTLDLAKALNESHRLSDMAKRKAEAELAKHMNPPEEPNVAPPDFSKLKPGDIVSFEGATESAADLPFASAPEREWLGFKAHLTVDDARALAEFFISRQIPFEQIAI